LRDGETQADALARVEAVLEAGYRGWQQRTRWQRRGLVDGGAGAVDPPGTTWRDRPAIDRGDGRWLAGDRVAAPGMLSEVSFHSARGAAKQLLEKALT
jgi:hypothetical protein